MGGVLCLYFRWQSWACFYYSQWCKRLLLSEGASEYAKYHECQMLWILLSTLWEKITGLWQFENFINLVTWRRQRWRQECLTYNCQNYTNYANPVYGVATICHQVRCLRWGHPSLFHTTASLLIWYKMFYMRNISYILTWMKFINMLSVFAQAGIHGCVNWLIIAVLT